MTVDPFSTKIRRFISAELNCKLERQCAYFSLVDREPESLLPEEISKRVADLEKLEQDEGFVYVGEKQWLDSISSGDAMTYAAWTQHIILTHVFQKRNFQPSLFDGRLFWDDEVWCGEYEPDQLLHVAPNSMHQLSGGYATFDCVAQRCEKQDVLPTPQDFQKVFYALHNICFFVPMVSPDDALSIALWDHAIVIEHTIGVVVFDCAMGLGKTTTDFIWGTRGPGNLTTEAAKLPWVTGSICKLLIYDVPKNFEVIENRYKYIEKDFTSSGEIPWLKHLMQNPQIQLPYPDWVAPILKERIFKDGFQWQPERQDGFELGERRPEPLNGCWSTELDSISGFDLGMQELNQIRPLDSNCIPLHESLRVSFEGGEELPPSNELLADLHEVVVNLCDFSRWGVLARCGAKPIPEGSRIRGIYLFQRRPYWQLEVLTPEQEPIHLDFCRRGHIHRIPLDKH